MMRRNLLFLLLLLTARPGMASEPFTSCPVEAFLFQGNPVSIYGVDLLTGQFSELQNNVGMAGNINGVGFNFDDRYLYGFNTSSFDVVRINRNFQAEALSVTGLPGNTTFFVGDVSDNKYWVYRKNVGLYSIDLDPNSADYLKAIQFEGADVSLNLTDFAFHPQDGRLYAVDNATGHAYRLSLITGQFEFIGATGVTGTFGAAYFDVDGYLYIGRNNDGNIYRIDLTSTETPYTEAQLFAVGPYSSQNDGARCAFAPVVSSNIDWGDAPDSYGTSLANNGARHAITGSLWLGDEAGDGELAPNIWPASDDLSVYDDEDGIAWSHSWVAGKHQVLDVKVNGAGYLNIWIDWNIDGEFAPHELVIQQWLDTGEHRLPLIVPLNATAGESWLRARFSSSQDVGATGGAVDGEVEDHPLSIASEGLSQRYYPSAGSWVTLAYEDRWPEDGDYDFNDVVLKYRLTETFSAQAVIRVDVDIEIQALGADYRSGFGVHLAGFDASQIAPQEVFRITPNQRQLFPSGVDQGAAVLTVSSNLVEHLPVFCRYFRTVTGCDSEEVIRLTLSAPMQEGVPLNALPDFPYDPFIFGAENVWRGQWLANFIKPTVEVHLADFPGTANVATSAWRLADDDSDPSQGRFYRNANHLPWALLFAEPWRHPKEGISLLQAYPQFQDWVESDSTNALDWYLEPNAIQKYLY